MTAADPRVRRWMNQPVCERCWFKREGERMPVRFRETTTEAYLCCFCGLPTIAGIWQRVDTKQPDVTVIYVEDED